MDEDLRGLVEKDLRGLIDYLNARTVEYDAGHPTISDREWDDLYFKLVQREQEEGIIYPDSPTQAVYFDKVSKLNKVTHDHPMLSLDKTKDLKEVEEFSGDKNTIYMLKLDGLTVSLKYLDGKFVSAETRGNGEVGEDITHNVRILKNVPMQIPIKDEFTVDGEVICNIEIFEEKFSKNFKNPRNYAAGAIRRLDAKENVDCGLSFVAWDCIKGLNERKLSSELFLLKDFGFTVVPFVIEHYDIEDDFDYLKKLAKLLGYPIDGIVIKYDDIDYYQSLGATQHHFRGGLAYKFYDEEYETTLKYIDYDVSRTGVLTPVAVFEPIDIDGSTVSRASLHNLSVMEETMGECCFLGQKLAVYKANQIIPQIAWAEKKNYTDVIMSNGTVVDKLTVCPICGTPAAIETSATGIKYLFCPNDQCEGKLAQQIDHFCGKKGLDIKGISRATIEKLIDWGWVNSIIDIFKLQSHRDEWISQPGFGRLSVNKILSAIEESSKNADLAAFISALGIPLVGRTIAKEIVKYYSTWEDFRDAVGGDWTIFDGFGPEISNAINKFNYAEADEIVKYLTFAIVTKNDDTECGSLTDLTFCVTGKLTSGKWKNRDELADYIASRGGKVVSAMSSKVNYLINNDFASASAKNVAAKKNNIPIITEAEFIDKFGQNC